VEDIVMKTRIVISGVALAGLLISGCSSPELEKSPYGQEEIVWEGFIKSRYPDWQAPQSVPPSATDEPLSPADIPALPPIIEIEETVKIKEVSPESGTYTIEKGDTLWGISKKVYGKGGEWKRILDANPDKIPNPDQLKVGTTINIPPKP
jgi:nucleoid-associated protein YgaU